MLALLRRYTVRVDRDRIGPDVSHFLKEPLRGSDVPSLLTKGHVGCM